MSYSASILCTVIWRRRQDAVKQIKYLFLKTSGMLSHAMFVTVYREICWFNKHPGSVMKKQTNKTGQPWYGMYTISYPPVDYVIQFKPVQQG